MAYFTFVLLVVGEFVRNLLVHAGSSLNPSLHTDSSDHFRDVFETDGISLLQLGKSVGQQAHIKKASNAATHYFDTDNESHIQSELPSGNFPILLQQAVSNTFPLPVWWVHVAKAGASFGKVVLSVPGVCNEPLPANENPNWFPEVRFVRQNCPGLVIPEDCQENLPLGFCMEHGIDSAYEGLQGNFVGMFRQPEQRLISDGQQQTQNDHELVSYAHQAQGCGTRMLTEGNLLGHCSDGTPPSKAQIPTALERLRNGFSFVGLTDRWDLSICLFSAMFKLPCRREYFDNLPGVHGSVSQHEPYNTSVLRGFNDQYDGPLYSVAVQVFNENMQRYNVSDEMCAACYAQAH